MNQPTRFLFRGLLLLGPAFFGSLLSASEPSSAVSFTLQPVEIRPLGADTDTPWSIHTSSLHIRSAPSLEHSKILGTVAGGTEVRGRYVIVEESDEEWLEVDFLGRPAYIFRFGFSRVHPENLEMIERHKNLPFGKELINRWWGIPLDYEADDLATIPAKYTRHYEGADYQLRREALESLMAMLDAMREYGLEAYVSSAYRSGSRQQSIYTRSTERRPSQRSSAPPGHSEHQLGTTVDLSSTSETRQSLRNTDPQHAWLRVNAAKYGWRQTYLADNIEETGYIEEPWHWRYVGRERP